MLRRAAGLLLPPLLALGVSEGLLWVAAFEAGTDPSKAIAWVRGDSGHYLSIALDGYELLRCPTGAQDGRLDWCGNTGWLPGYPLTLRCLRAAGMRLRRAGRWVSMISLGAALLVLWTLFVPGRGSPRSLLALGLAAVFPGAVYHHAVFPISLFTLLALLALLAAARGDWLRASLAGAGSAFTYSTGILLAPLLAMAALRSPGTIRRRLARAALVGILVGVGLLAVFAMHAREVGAWDAFFRIQWTYGHGVHNPVATWLARLSEPLSLQGERRFAPALQTALVTGWMVALSLAVWIRRADLDRREWLLAGYGLLFWLVPLVVGEGVALHRAEALLLPTVGLASRLPGPLLLAFVLGAAALLFPMGLLFFTSSLL